MEVSRNGFRPVPKKPGETCPQSGRDTSGHVPAALAPNVSPGEGGLIKTPSRYVGRQTATAMGTVSRVPDLRPILGEIARLWPQIHPGDLTAPQALKLLGAPTEIVEGQ